MTVLQQIDAWREGGTITAQQHATLAALVRKERFSVFLELNALLYLGVILLAAGIGWSIQTYFTNIGDTLILAVLTLLFAACFAYCFLKSPAWSSEMVQSPTLGFDYILYLGCLLFAIELGYMESRFQILKSDWNYWLLLSASVFFVLSYRFDNRFVLSLGLSSLAGWFGLKASRWGFTSSESLRVCAMGYAAIVIAGGTFLYRQRIKRHFLETYLHVAANVMFITTLSALAEHSREWVYLPLLVALTTTSIALGIRHRRFVFVVYGTVFGYIGLSMELLRGVTRFTSILAYFVVTGTGVILLMATMARRFGREE